MAFFDGSPELTFQDMGRQYALRSVRGMDRMPRSRCASAGEWRKVSTFLSPDAEYFRRHLQHANPTELRKFLANSGFSSQPFDSMRIFSRIAELVSNGDLALFERSGSSAGAPGPVSGGGSPKQDAQGVEPILNTCPVDLVVNKPPTAPKPVKSTLTVDPKMQASVLQAAARHGVPFCELCNQT